MERRDALNPSVRRCLNNGGAVGGDGEWPRPRRGARAQAELSQALGRLRRSPACVGTVVAASSAAFRPRRLG